MPQRAHVVDDRADVVPVGRDRRQLMRIARRARRGDQRRHELRLLRRARGCTDRSSPPDASSGRSRSCPSRRRRSRRPPDTPSSCSPVRARRTRPPPACPRRGRTARPDPRVRRASPAGSDALADVDLRGLTGDGRHCRVHLHVVVEGLELRRLRRRNSCNDRKCGGQDHEHLHRRPHGCDSRTGGTRPQAIDSPRL